MFPFENEFLKEKKTKKIVTNVKYIWVFPEQKFKVSNQG